MSTKKRKIKIVRVIARVIIGGPTIHVAELARLDSDRFESLLVCGLENPGEADMRDYVLEHGIRVEVIPEIVGEANFDLKDIIAIAKLYRLLLREKPQIVDTHTAKAGFVGRISAHLAGVPVIIHTYHGHVMRGYYGSLKTWLLRWLERLLGYATDGIIAVSESVRQEIARYGVAPLSKIETIPLGFDLQPFLENRTPRGEFRNAFGIPHDVPLVGIVGRIVPIKNHRLFLQAAQLVLRFHPLTCFVIVGDGPLRSSLEELARDLRIEKNVIFAGWYRDRARIYSDLNVLTVSSINEGTPVSVIETLASGCPVVATNVGGVPDVVLNEKVGILVPSDDPQKMADAIVRLLDNPEFAQQMGKAGQIFVSQNFTSERLIADTTKFYNRLLASKGLI